MQSCSNNEDSINEIIGYWHLIERYESDIQIDLHCDKPFQIQFEKNNDMLVSYLVQYLSTAEECKNIDMTNYNWKKNGDKYEIYQFPNKIYGKAFFEDDYLILNLTDFPNKYVLKKIIVVNESF